jgi:hypothetical protein
MPRFSPYRRASRGWLRVALFLVGPVLWVVALSFVAVVVSRTDLILIGTLIAVGSFVVAIVLLAIVRRLRIAEERDGSAPR